MEFGTWSSAGGRGECSSAAEMTPSPEVWACSAIALAASKFLHVFIIFGSILCVNSNNVELLFAVGCAGGE
jgi:hypothetical protein